MKKDFYKRNIRVLLCLLLFSLLLNGCGRSDSEETSEFLTEPNLENSGDLENQETASKQMKESETSAQTQEDARETIKHIISDTGFQLSAYVDAGMEAEDSEEIIYQKLEQCKSLTLDSRDKISSLEYLSLMPNLETLTIDVRSLEDSAIKNLTPIAGLSKLEALDIRYGTEEMELSFLAEMKNIKELYLPNCQIKDFSFLEDMPQLERLSLYETPIEDLAVLEKLPNLVELALKGNAAAQNIETVGKLSKMQDLGLQDCGIKDIRFLSSLTELKGINLNNNAITDLTPLAGMTKLERLGAANNQIKDISVLSGMSNMYDLALDNNEISDISALSEMSRLNQVGLSNNRILDLSPLAGKEELLYAAVSGNLHTDITPIQQVPLLYCMNNVVTDEQVERAQNWMLTNHKDILNPDSEFYCIDYAEGDLNQDGRMDIAFVIEGDFISEYGALDRDKNMGRCLFVLLKQEDGSFQELVEASDIPIRNPDGGGMRGDPYRGFFMGNGCLMMKSAWGSSGGEMDMDFYKYQNGKLEQSQIIAVSDYNFSYGYDVWEKDFENNTWCRYVIAMDGPRMVRVNLEDSAHEAHRAFPEIDLYDMHYYIYDEKVKSKMTATDALDKFCKALEAEQNGLSCEKEELPYASWQKEGYEKLIGITLPDYYYVIPGTEDYIYYTHIMVSGDGQLYHIITHVSADKKTDYRINDATGEITKKKYDGYR